jgi:DDE family transposase
MPTAARDSAPFSRGPGFEKAQAGYEDVKDAERLSQDPAFRLIGSEKVSEPGAALTSRLQFETELLMQPENLAGLARISRDLIAKTEVIDSGHRVVLDMDSTEVPVYGRQETQLLQRALPVHRPRSRVSSSSLYSSSRVGEIRLAGRSTYPCVASFRSHRHGFSSVGNAACTSAAAN